MADSDQAKLTPLEEKSILRIWNLVQKDLKENSVQFFLHFFRGYPEYQRIFRGFSDVPLEKLAENKRLRAHALTVFSAINSLVENLDDPELLEELLLKTGRNHGKRQLTRGDFENLKESLLVFMEKALGEEWTPEAEIAWNKLLNVMVAKISEGMQSDE